MTTQNKKAVKAKDGEEKAKGQSKAAHTKNKKPMGRPSTYSQEMADTICEMIAEGKSLREVCEPEGMPTKSTVFRWLTLHGEFSDMYARAREVQAETMADEILSIADDGRNDKYVDEEGRERTDQDVIARSRLRVDARKWLAAKLMPRKYGEKIESTLKGDADAPIAIQRIERVVVDPKK